MCLVSVYFHREDLSPRSLLPLPLFTDDQPPWTFPELTDTFLVIEVSYWSISIL